MWPRAQVDQSATTGDFGPDRDPALSPDNPGLDHGPSGGHGASGPDLLPSSLQSIPRAHNEEPTNERRHTVSESNSLDASSNGVPPDTNNHRPRHIPVRVWLEQRKPQAVVEAGRKPLAAVEGGRS